jgi:hypothetical protein
MKKTQAGAESKSEGGKTKGLGSMFRNQIYVQSTTCVIMSHIFIFRSYFTLRCIKNAKGISLNFQRCLEARSGQNDKGCGRKKAEPGEDFPLSGQGSEDVLH